MGHADITTGLVYFQTSTSQAERVNKALGISEIYSQVAKIAIERFISTRDLANLKDDQQVGGAPHGFPIAGIGGCSSGQPTCPYSPVTSCYGCQKFMPVVDVDLHQKVLSDMRQTVKLFEHSARGDSRSPAYMQLKHTITSIEQVITQVEGLSRA